MAIGIRLQTLSADPQSIDLQSHPVGLDPFVDARGAASYFVTQALRQRIELIRHLLEFGRQIIIVTGSHGTGKTSLLDRVTDPQEKNWRVLRYIAGPTLNRSALLDKVAGDLGADTPVTAAGRIQENIRAQVQAASQHGETIVLAIDDAHRLPAGSPACIAELAYCVDESTEIKIVLSADPAQSALADQLQSESSQHALVHIVEMPRFNGEQTVAMLTHRWNAAYGTQEIPLDSSDMAQISQAASGIPEKAIVLARQFQSQAKNAQRQRQDPARRFLIGGVVFLVLFSLFAFFYADDATDPEESQIDVQLPAEQFTQPVLSKNSDPAPKSSDNASAVANPRASSNDMPKLMPPAEPELPPIDQAPEDTPPSAPIVTPTPEDTPSVVQLIDEDDKTAATAPDVQLIDENNIPDAAPSEPEPPPIAAAIEIPVQPAQTVTTSAPLPAYSVKWLRTRPAGGYVLQLFGVRNRVVAVKFIKDRKIGKNSAVLITNHAGAPWYVVVHGYYPDRASARAAITDLPPKLTATEPWARPIASLN